MDHSKIFRGFLIIFFFTYSHCQAQYSFTGVVTDKENNNPVAGAVINIEGLFDFAITNENGKFTINNIQLENPKLLVTHISYDTISIIAKAGENNISLQRTSYITEEVNVSALRGDNNFSIFSTLVDKTEIRKNNLGSDIPFILNLTPSLVSTSDGGTGIGYSGLRIRGSDGTRINVTINGVPVNDAESHQVYWVDLPDLAASIENIQIQRGIGTSTNGAGAFGGSINILTNKLSVEPYGSINSSAGSFNTFKNSAAFGTGLLSNVFAFEGRLSIIKSDGYIDRSSSDLRSFYLSGGYYGKSNSLRAIIISGKEKTYQAWYGVPQDSLFSNRTFNPAGIYTDNNGEVKNYENQTDNYQQDYYQLLFSHDFNHTIMANAGIHLTHGEGYYEEYQPDQKITDYGIDQINSSITTSDSIADLVRRLWLKNNFYVITWSVETRINKLSLVAGGAANRYDGDHFGEVIASEVMNLNTYPFRYYNDNAKKDDINFYVRSSTKLFSKCEWNADLQYRVVNYDFEGFDEQLMMNMLNSTLHFFNPKTGITYNLSDKTKLYFSIAQGHKEPVRDDFIHSTPDKRPKAENMVDYEGGIRIASGKTLVIINGYFMNYINQLILTGKINDVGEYIRQNVYRSYRAGIEGELSYNISPKLNLKVNATFSRNKLKTFVENLSDDYGTLKQVNIYRNTDIAFSPAVIAAAVISYQMKNLNVELTGKYVGRQFLDNTESNDRMLKAYLINDLKLYYKVKVQRLKEFSLSFSLNNILNVDYISNGNTYSTFNEGRRSDYNNYFPQAKRNFLAGVSVKF